MVEDLQKSLAIVTDPALVPYRDFALKALAAFRDGHPESAQSLVATTLTTMMATIFNLKKFKAARQKFDKDPMDASINTFRNWCVQAQLCRSLQPFYADADRIPEQFNRMASAHTISAIQFTEVISLASLLLLNAFLRETHLLSSPEEDAA